LRIILVGFGVVGKSIAKVFVDQRERLRRMFGLNPKVVAIVEIGGALVNSRGIDLSEVLEVIKSPDGLQGVRELWREGAKLPELLEELDCDVMIELTPTDLSTGQPGLDHVRAALQNEVNVVTTNKGPLALAMPALLEIAEYNDVILKFSGTVGGGTPMLDFAKKCLEGEEIVSIRGILNGTTNYILTKMDAEGVSLENALSEAKALGYAEADPTYDIDGFDSAGKLVIMANWVMGRSLSIRDIKITGIRNVNQEQIENARAEGKTIKLIASCEEKAEVRPMAISRDHPLNVSGTINALTFATDLADEITLVGRGAGGMETASAVLRDLIDIRKSYSMNIPTPQRGA